MSNWKVVGRSLLVVAAMVLAPVAAQAQNEGLAAAGSSSLSSTVAVPLTGLGVAIYGTYTTTKKETPSEGKAAAAYLRANEVQLRQDLAVGAGPAIADLAAVAEIKAEHLDLFGRLLRQHRAELLELADSSKMTSERALQFLSSIGALIKADAVLAVNQTNFVARHGQGS